jgi:ribonuclease VapC
MKIPAGDTPVHNVRVLDSWAIMEWINKSHAGETVAALLSDAEAGKVRLWMSAINVGEVYYFLRKHVGAALAESWREISPAAPLTIDVPTLEDIWRAAQIKGDYPVSYADAFAAALARKHNCPLLTGDPEFRSITGLDIDWIGPRR